MEFKCPECDNTMFTIGKNGELSLHPGKPPGIRIKHDAHVLFKCANRRCPGEVSSETLSSHTEAVAEIFLIPLNL